MLRNNTLIGEETNTKLKESRKGSEETVFIHLKHICFTFNLWKCMEQMKYNCKLDFDH